MAVLRQTDRADFTFEAGSLDADALRVLRFRGTEGISQLFRFEIDLVSPEEIDFDAVVGEKAALAWRGVEEDDERWVHGIVSRFEQTQRGRELTHYTARLVPKVWTLGLSRRCRIFQNLATDAILKKVLEGAGIPSDQFKLSLKRTYKERKYCVQYRESDFDFLSRLMEEEGIFYHFDPTKDGHVMVIGDDSTGLAKITGEPLPYHEGGSSLESVEEVKGFRFSRSVRTGAVVLRDFDFKKPGFALKSEKKSDNEAHHEYYDYPGRFPDTAIADDLVKIRLEEQRTERELGVGEGDCRRFASGFKFELEGHPRGTFNQEYLLVRVHHWGDQRQAAELDAAAPGNEPVYRNTFECIPSKVPYRPSRITPRPRVDGPQTGLVTGPKGEEIHVDEFGRVKVQFHWDREATGDDKTSCWVRVSQGWGGTGWGSIFIPRVGQEVVVDFLEGDPDRPLITGTVFNGENLPPYTLPDDKTKTAIKSASSPGSDGFNELRFEDAKGKEQVFIHAEKDLDFRVKNDEREWLGNDRSLFVKRDRREQIERDAHLIVKRDEISEIGRDHNLAIKGKEAIQVTGSRSLTVNGDVIDVFKMNHSEQVTGDYYVKGMNVVIEGMTGLTIKVGGNFISINSGGIFVKGTMLMLNSGGAALSGVAGSAVSPASPLEAEIADVAQPGSAAKTYRQQREQMSPAEKALLNAPTHQESKQEDPAKKWIEIQLVDEADQPVPGKRYAIKLPDGKTATGTTGPDGVARVTGVEPGTCQISFPDLDKDAWEKA